MSKHIEEGLYEDADWILGQKMNAKKVKLYKSSDKIA